MAAACGRTLGSHWIVGSIPARHARKGRNMDIIYKAERIGFLKGMIVGISLYAVWRDGRQEVGVLRRPLEIVLWPYQKELDQLQKECIAWRRRGSAG